MLRGAVPSALLGALLLLPAATAGLVPLPRDVERAAMPLVPREADAYVVAGTFALSNATLHLTGDLVVLPGARFTMRDVTVVFQATRDAHPALRIAAGAAVDAMRVTLTNDAVGSPAKRAASWFDVAVHGNLALVDSVVEHARVIEFYGPTSVGNLVEDSTIRHSALAGLSFTKEAAGIVRGNHVHSNFRIAEGTIPGAAVTVYDTDDVLVEGNLFEDLLGDAAVVVQSTGTGSYVWKTAAVVRSNLYYDSGAARDARGLGTRAVFVEGANPATLVADNALAVAWQGVLAAYGAGVLVSGNDLLSVSVPGAYADRAEDGLRANGADAFGRASYHPYFEKNRVRGFLAAASAVNGGTPAFHANSFDSSNAIGLAASNTTVDAARNWWGPAGPAGRIEGDVDARDALRADPSFGRALDVRVALGGAGVIVTIVNRADEPRSTELFLRNAPGAPARIALDAAPGETTIEVPLSALPAAGTDLVALARAGASTAVASSRA